MAKLHCHGAVVSEFRCTMPQKPGELFMPSALYRLMSDGKILRKVQINRKGGTWKLAKCVSSHTPDGFRDLRELLSRKGATIE